MFYGTLLKAPMIVSSVPDILKRASDEGHDCGIHCWDHVLWQDCLYGMSRAEIRAEFSKAIELFSRVTGYAPRSCAGLAGVARQPGRSGRIGVRSLRRREGRGAVSAPHERTSFRAVQIPTTLPTLDEVWGTGGLNSQNAPERYFSLLKPGLNVHTAHAEMEGGGMSGVFAGFLDRCEREGVIFPTLRDVAARLAGTPDVKTADVEMGEISGRAGKVALQR